MAILDQTEDQENLAEEQAILDDHEDRVEELIEGLEHLVVTTEPVMPQASNMSNCRRVVIWIAEADHLSERMD